MSNQKYKLPFQRFVRQVRTEPHALLNTGNAAEQAALLLRSAEWVPVPDAESTFPPRNATQDGFRNVWDAFKFCGNYAAGEQRAYAGMVAYRFAVPSSGVGVLDVVSVDLPVSVDRWLVDGVRVAAYTTDATVPSTDWLVLREGSVYEADVLPMEYTEDDPPKRIVVDKSDTVSLAFTASTKVRKYVWVILSLQDYNSVRGFWIEGGAAINGGAVEVELSGSAPTNGDGTEPVRWAIVPTPMKSQTVPTFKSCPPDACYFIRSFWLKDNYEVANLEIRVASGVTFLGIGNSQYNLTGAITTTCPFAGIVVPNAGAIALPGWNKIAVGVSGTVAAAWAGAVVTTRTEGGKNRRVLVTSGKDDLIPWPDRDGMLIAAAFQEGSLDPKRVWAGDSVYMVDGVERRFRYVTDLQFSQAYTINNAQVSAERWGAFLIQANTTTGAYSIIASAQDQTYLTSTDAQNNLPLPSAGNVAVAYILIRSRHGNRWTANTSTLVVAGGGVAYIEFRTMPFPRNAWSMYGVSGSLLEPPTSNIDGVLYPWNTRAYPLLGPI